MSWASRLRRKIQSRSTPNVAALKFWRVGGFSGLPGLAHDLLHENLIYQPASLRTYFTSPPGGVRYLAMSVSVCLSAWKPVCMHISITACPKFTKFSVHCYLSPWFGPFYDDNAVCCVPSVLWMGGMKDVVVWSSSRDGCTSRHLLCRLPCFSQQSNCGRLRSIFKSLQMRTSLRLIDQVHQLKGSSFCRETVYEISTNLKLNCPSRSWTKTQLMYEQTFVLNCIKTKTKLIFKNWKKLKGMLTTFLYYRRDAISRIA